MSPIAALAVGSIWVSTKKKEVVVVPHSPTGKVRVSLVALDR